MHTHTHNKPKFKKELLEGLDHLVLWMKATILADKNCSIVRSAKTNKEQLTKPAKAKVAFEGLKQQQFGTDSHRRILEE